MALLKNKYVLALLIAGIAVAVANHFNLLPSAIVQEAEVPHAVELATEAATVETGNVSAIPLPTSKPGSVKSAAIRVNIWEWNAQMGLLFANGGPTTTAGSLMEKHGVNVKITRQDDTNVSQSEQIKFANALVKNPNPSEGVHFVIIMGDQAAGYLSKCNGLIEKLGPDFVCEIVGAVGYSRGEDAWWGPQEWKDDPQSAKGKGTVGVLREGDWNITLFKLANDGIKNNPDETTWDMDAHNWFSVSTIQEASKLWLADHCEERDIVSNGRKTGEKHKACVEGITTWTPEDVNIAKNKGGLVRLLSTAENIYQMPAVVIGVRKWNNDHVKQVTEFLAAALAGSDQVKNYDTALSKAGQIAYAVYADQSAAYWVKYYKGVVERDKTGIPVPLGGSAVANLGDNLVLFGLAEGAGGIGGSVFRASYEGFGNVVKQQYPALMPSFPPVSEAVNTRFLQELMARNDKAAEGAAVATFDETKEIAKESVVAQRNWAITFATGSASFDPSALNTLDQLYNQLMVGGALSVEIQGHTDNVGNPAANQTLSERRANAVKAYLEQKNPLLFPTNRVIVNSFGDSRPLASNASAEGKARNRRVTVILGTTR